MNVTGLIPALRPVSQKEQLEAVWKLLPSGCLVGLQLTQEKLNHVCQFPHRLGAGSSSTRVGQPHHSEARLISSTSTVQPVEGSAGQDYIDCVPMQRHTLMVLDYVLQCHDFYSRPKSPRLC